MPGQVIKKAMKPRSTKGRAAAKRAATMTFEEWKAVQVGQEKKWPLPEYMGGTKGHTRYQEETYSIILHWAATTRITYRPHAKSPGSKSHVRYEAYSKAKTVGQALALGTFPADWCWDYERGFIKVHGPVRKEPVDLTKEDESKLTDVDRVIHRWYKMELAKMLGLKVTDLHIGKGGAEVLTMRAHRLVAQRDAKQMLEKADKAGSCISDQDMEHILNKWHFAKNPNRVNVMPDGQDWVFSDTLGLNRDRCGDIHLAQATCRYPQVTELMTRWLTERLPAEVAKDFSFTSLNVNFNYAAKIHRDNNNFGPSVISAFGAFTGGSLNYWPEDDKSLGLDKLPKAKKVSLSLGDGLAMFNGNCAHSVDKFEGHRYSIVYFTMGCHAKAPEAAKQQLRDLGMPYPAVDEDRFKLLRPPQGVHKSAASLSKAPAHRYWKLAALKPKRQKVLKKTTKKN